jgi:hypothetical protein
MINRFAFLLFLFFMGCASTKSGYVKELPISGITFKSHFGQDTKDSSIMYSLLGMGYFRAPSSDNSDSLIQNWIANHPGAFIFPVYSQGPFNTKVPNSKFIYVIVIDKNDTLNNFLVKNGCYPGGTMQRPHKWSEMDSKERQSYSNDKFEDINVYIKDSDYNIYINQILNAEKHAHDNKLGIWKKMAQ